MFTRCMTALSKIIRKKRTGTSPKTSNDCHESTSVEVSEKTIQRQLLKFGYHKRSVAKQTNKQANKQKTQRRVSKSNMSRSTAEAQSTGLYMEKGDIQRRNDT